jgi:hypothetical protein
MRFGPITRLRAGRSTADLLRCPEQQIVVSGFVE